MRQDFDVLTAAHQVCDDLSVGSNDRNLSARRSALKSSYLEGALYSLVIATAESFALVFAVSRGFHTYQVGLLTTLPLLLAAMVNLVLPRFVDQSRLKHWLLGLVSFQVGGLLLLLVSSLSEAPTFMGIFIALSVYWIGGLAASPLWVDWMSGWLPTTQLGSYFSRRSAFISFITLCFTLLCAGVAHEFGKSTWFFSALFAFAAISRIGALVVLSLRPDPEISQIRKRRLEKDSKSFSFRQLLGVSVRPLVYILIGTTVFRFVVNIASPYFLPYMIKDLGFDTSTLALLQAMTYLSSFFFMASFGESLRRFSMLVGLQVSMMGIVGVSIAWCFFQDAWLIAGIQFFNGIFWAGFDLALVLMIQSAFPQTARRLMGIQIACAQVAAVGGSAVGAWLLQSGWTHLHVIEVSTLLRVGVTMGIIVWLNPAHREKFSVDTLARFLGSLFLPRKAWHSFVSWFF